MSPRIAAALLATLGLSIGCGGSGASDQPADGGPVFIALDRDFAAYDTWTLFQFEGESQGRVHPTGTRKVYINKLPALGANKFGVGTMIVKEIFDKNPPAHTVYHAMVKRGGGFNASDGGARDWEYFEIVRPDGGTPSIDWRGIAPPPGKGYGAAFGGLCNDCHGLAGGNDYVQSPPLQFDGGGY